MEQKILNDAAKAAAKVIFESEIPEGGKASFSGELAFDISFKRGIGGEVSCPQKLKPWSLVKLLVAKLDKEAFGASASGWLDELVLAAASDELDDAVEARFAAIAAKLLPQSVVARKGAIRVEAVHAVWTSPRQGVEFATEAAHVKEAIAS